MLMLEIGFYYYNFKLKILNLTLFSFPFALCFKINFCLVYLIFKAYFLCYITICFMVINIINSFKFFNFQHYLIWWKKLKFLLFTNFLKQYYLIILHNQLIKLIYFHLLKINLNKCVIFITNFAILFLLLISLFRLYLCTNIFKLLLFFFN